MLLRKSGKTFFRISSVLILLSAISLFCACRAEQTPQSVCRSFLKACRSENGFDDAEKYMWIEFPYFPSPALNRYAYSLLGRTIKSVEEVEIASATAIYTSGDVRAVLDILKEDLPSATFEVVTADVIGLDGNTYSLSVLMGKDRLWGDIWKVLFLEGPDMMSCYRDDFFTKNPGDKLPAVEGVRTDAVKIVRFFPGIEFPGEDYEVLAHLAGVQVVQVFVGGPYGLSVSRKEFGEWQDVMKFYNDNSVWGEVYVDDYDGTVWEAFGFPEPELGTIFVVSEGEPKILAVLEQCPEESILDTLYYAEDDIPGLCLVPKDWTVAEPPIAGRVAYPPGFRKWPMDESPNIMRLDMGTAIRVGESEMWPDFTYEDAVDRLMCTPKDDFEKISIGRWEGRQYEVDEVGVALIFCDPDGLRFRYWVADTFHYYQFADLVDDFRSAADYFVGLNAQNPLWD